jgi:hypothetical protein
MLLAMPRNSVLATQKPLLELSREIRETEARLERMKARLERLTHAHKEQIRRSLTSKDPEERAMAEGVAAWYDVRPTTD